MNMDLKRYNLFGWDYELINPLTPQEIDWYVRFAGKTGGPLLGLACGTARLLVALAWASFEADGIDLSTSMLEVAKKHISLLPSQICCRIRLHHMDMSSFALDQKIGLIFIADNSFRELKTREQQLSCLRCVRHHLHPDGKFLMTERRFDPQRFRSGQRDMAWSSPIPLRVLLCSEK